MSIYRQRCEQYCFDKQCIGSYIAHYLRRNALYRPIAVDGGSTNWYVLRAICRDAREKRPTVSQVLTNHLEGIYLAQDLPDEVPLLWRCTGGVLRPSRAVFVEGADEAVRECAFWIAVVGANGFDPPWLQTTTEREHSVKKAMVYGASSTVIFPIDSSKWGPPAGKYLLTLDEIVSMHKRVMLVTCYPIQEKGESGRDFTERINLFLDKVRTFSQQWPYNIEVFTAPVSEGEVEFTDTKLPSVAMLANELRGAYAQTISPGQESQTGFIVRFDLWT